MNILAVDTATRSISVAVSKDEDLLAEVLSSGGQTHSSHLMGLVETTLAMARTDLAAIDGFAVTRGPGSFTGLRIGISTMKGLAEALRKPLVGVSCLKTLAFQAGPCAQMVCSMIDARRGELYFAVYHHAEGELIEVVPESVGPPSAVMEKAVLPCLFIGNGAALYQTLLMQGLGPMASFAWTSQNMIRAAAVAQLSLLSFQNGQTDDVEHFGPLYLRPSDAQVKVKNPG
jgi:tRNA threonylcarbamoyladenosine biosynthesis protein TsaB